MATQEETYIGIMIQKPGEKDQGFGRNHPLG